MAVTPHNILLYNITNTNGNSSMQNNTNTSLGGIYSPNVFNPTAWNIIEIVILGIVCVMILLGNALVILAFVKGPRSIRTHTNYFVVNLAVCDFMVGCLSVPFWMCVSLSKFSYLICGDKLFFIKISGPMSWFSFFCYLLRVIATGATEAELEMLQTHV